mgnify:CR=1 FL=1
MPCNWKIVAEGFSESYHVQGIHPELLASVDDVNGPQRIFGMRGKGRIAVGYDADLSIVDMKRRATITDQWIRSKSNWTPYHGVSVQGWPVGTIVRGTLAMWEGELGVASGEPVRFGEALPRDPLA